MFGDEASFWLDGTLHRTWAPIGKQPRVDTFGERKSYIIPVSGTGAGVISQTCDKEMYVSPFTSRHGRYEFRVLPPNERVFVGVDFRDSEGLLLKTSFGGERRALSTLGILRLVVSHPLMMVKVVAGIHFEAVRLWMKGVPLVERHTSPSFSFSIVPVAKRDQ